MFEWFYDLLGVRVCIQALLFPRPGPSPHGSRSIPTSYQMSHILISMQNNWWFVRQTIFFSVHLQKAAKGVFELGALLSKCFSAQRPVNGGQVGPNMFSSPASSSFADNVDAFANGIWHDVCYQAFSSLPYIRRKIKFLLWNHHPTNTFYTKYKIFEVWRIWFVWWKLFNKALSLRP